MDAFHHRLPSLKFEVKQRITRGWVSCVLHMHSGIILEDDEGRSAVSGFFGLLVASIFEILMTPSNALLNLSLPIPSSSHEEEKI